MKRILLLGAYGRLGTAIRKMHALTSSRRWSSSSEIQPVGHTSGSAPSISIDTISGMETLSALDFDMLINCAAFHKLDKCEVNPADAFHVNSYAARALAMLCERKRAFFIHISTDYVFGGTPPAGDTYVEADRPGPLNIYGASKLMGESLARSMWPETAIIRVASLFGRTASTGKGPDFVQAMLSKAVKHERIEVVDAIRMSPTSADDAAVAILTIAAHRRAGTWHAVNSGPPATWFEVARATIHQKLGGYDNLHIRDPELDPSPTRPRMSALSNDKLFRFGIEMPDWRYSLADYVESL